VAVVVFFFFFQAILGVTFDGILLTIPCRAIVIACLTGFGLAFNAVATNWEMLMSGK